MAAIATAQRSRRTSTATARGGTQTQKTRRTTAKSTTAKRTPASTRSTAARSTAAKTTRGGARPQRARRTTAAAGHQHDITMNVPRRVVEVAETPFVIAGRVLPAKKGLPVYVGLGALAVVEAISWPVAVGIGIAYESIRRWGPRPSERRPQSQEPKQ